MAVLSSGGLYCGKTSAHNTIVSNDFLQSAKPVSLRLEQRGNTSGIVAIVVLDTLLNIVTLSIYRFWGKTKVRQYLWR